MKTLKDASNAWLDATAPSEEGLARLTARIEAGSDATLGARRTARPTALRRALLLVVTGLALAAGLLATLRPTPIERALEASGEAPLSTDVRVRWDGLGHAAGSTAAPRLAWSRGRLDVDVTPGQGVDLRVATDEAEVSVVGTRFVVDRDALGTRVQVAHGVVQVRCVTRDGFAAPVSLHAEDTVECRPVHAVGLLQRARALDTQDPAAALVDVDAALADPARPPSLDDELRALRIGLLDRLGRGDEVVAAALAYVGGTRTDEIARLGLAWTAADPDARCRLLAALRAPTQAELAARCAVEPSAPVPTLPE